FARDFVDFVYVNDAALGALDVIVSILEQAQDDIFDVFADVAGLGEGGGVRDGKRDIQSAGEGAGEQGFARASVADEEEIAFFDFDFARAGGGPFFLGAGGWLVQDALVMVVDGDGQRSL